MYIWSYHTGGIWGIDSILAIWVWESILLDKPHMYKHPNSQELTEVSSGFPKKYLAPRHLAPMRTKVAFKKNNKNLHPLILTEYVLENMRFLLSYHVRLEMVMEIHKGWYRCLWNLQHPVVAPRAHLQRWRNIDIGGPTNRAKDGINNIICLILFIGSDVYDWRKPANHSKIANKNSCCWWLTSCTTWDV